MGYMPSCQNKNWASFSAGAVMGVTGGDYILPLHPVVHYAAGAAMVEYYCTGSGPGMDKQLLYSTAWTMGGAIAGRVVVNMLR